jgi:hypothetical protein
MAFRMTARIRPRACTWPRASRYEFRDGCIAPANDAKVRVYKPWSDYDQSKRETRAPAPYLALVSLVDGLRKELHAKGWSALESAGVPPALSERSLAAVLAWTERHGPLGIFHQTTVHFEEPGTGRGWTRAGGRWHQLPALSGGKHDPTCLVSAVIDAPDVEARKSRAHLTKFLGPELPPEVASPDSAEFFAIYHEPLWDWIVAAEAIVDAILDRDDEVLNALAGAAARVRRFERDRVESQIIFPSLVSAYAEMVFQDFEAGNLLRTCRHCSDLFITDRKWTSYCSPRCATKERQRRFLEQNPEYYRRDNHTPGGKAKRGKVKA